MDLIDSIRAIPRRRLARLVAGPLLACAPVWGAARLMIALNAEPPAREAEGVRSALDGARRARAREFAENDLKLAEAAAQQALLEYHRGLGETTGVFRYDVVRRHLHAAREKADWAWTRARQRSDAARDESRRLILQSRAGLRAAYQDLASAPIGHAVRKNLAQARVAVGSASLRWRAGDFSTATREASYALRISEQVRGRAQSFRQTYTTGASAQKWASDIATTVAASRQTGGFAVVVDKLNHRCHLYKGGRLVKTYPADLGGPIADKLRSGDRATPEGRYRIIQKRGPGQTIYHKALLINYPNQEDQTQFHLAKKNGWISRHSSIGGLIEIHGNGGRREDWTLGCVALSNRDMDDLFQYVSVGTPVTIVGTVSR